jgi:hypothetical protein
MHFQTDPPSVAVEDDYSLGLDLRHPQNPQFTGREDKLESLHKLLMVSGDKTCCLEATPVVLLGAGGVGKTQLSRQYAYTYSSSYTSITWIHGQSLGTIYTGFHTFACRLVRHYAARNQSITSRYAALARHLNLSGLINSNGDVSFNHNVRDQVVEAVKNWLSFSRNTGWLLIFDEVDDLEGFDLTKFFPMTTTNGKILITTRRREGARFGRELELGVLGEAESIELLRRSSRRKQKFTGQGMHYTYDLPASFGLQIYQNEMKQNKWSKNSATSRSL